MSPAGLDLAEAGPVSTGGTPAPRRAVIFTDDPGWHGERLGAAFAARGWAWCCVSLRDCRFDLAGEGSGLVIPGFERLPDAAFVRGVPGGTLEEVVYYLDVLHALRRLGVLVYNDGRTIERSVDKGMTSFLLHAAGVPTPPAWVLHDPAAAARVLAAERAAGHDLVCKPLFGSQGAGLVRLDGDSTLPDPAACNGVYYLQRFIPGRASVADPAGTGGAEDYRVFVVAGRALAVMRRSTAAGWITNVAQGAACHPATLEPDLCDLAAAAAAALEMGYAGVDIVRDAAGHPWVLEVNGIPAWRALQRVCDLDIAAALVHDLLRRWREGLG